MEELIRCTRGIGAPRCSRVPVIPCKPWTSISSTPWQPSNTTSTTTAGNFINGEFVGVGKRNAVDTTSTITESGLRCCYDNDFFDDNSTVASFPLSCLQFICAMGIVKPYDPFPPCTRDCCLTNNGELVGNLQKWSDKCEIFMCIDGVATKIRDDPQCCYYEGEWKKDGDTWYEDNDCVKMICNKGEIETEVNSSCCQYGPSFTPSGSMIAGVCAQLFCQDRTWVETGLISSKCRHCRIYNDPHFNNFFGFLFDEHSTCNHSLSQSDKTYEPTFGVFAEFRKCNWAASCIKRTTFRADPNTVIEIGLFGLNNLAAITVNGDPYTIGTTPEFITGIGGVVHRVIAWKHHNCIRLQGTHYLIYHCIHSIAIYYHEDDSNDIYGLCGNPFLGVAGNEIPRTPGQPWKESWKTDDQSSTTCDSQLQLLRMSIDDDCTELEMRNFTNLCAEKMTKNPKFEDLYNQRLDIDLCPARPPTATNTANRIPATSPATTTTSPARSTTSTTTSPETTTAAETTTAEIITTTAAEATTAEPITTTAARITTAEIITTTVAEATTAEPITTTAARITTAGKITTTAAETTIAGPEEAAVAVEQIEIATAVAAAAEDQIAELLLD